MALIHCDYFSDVLGMHTSMKVILPQKAQRQIGTAGIVERDSFPTLYLLHGLSDDESAWTRRTSIERYVEPLGLAVVMPTTHRGFYVDAQRGYRYFTHIAEEVPSIAQRFFPLSDAREENYVAGLSMGGYGAFLLATRNPGTFCAGASLSGAADMASLYQQRDNLGAREMENIFGPLEQLRGAENDLFATTRVMAESDGPKAKLYQCCGTEDYLYEMNIRFRDFAQALPLDFTYAEGPGGHGWDYWDETIRDVLAWLPLPESTESG